jgi:hypothetical protein
MDLFHIVSNAPDHEYEFGSAEGEPAPAAAKFQAFFSWNLERKIQVH